MEPEQIIDIAAGREPAELVLRNGHIVNVVSNEILQADVAIAGESIVGIGEYEGAEIVDLGGQYICPGFIDGHVHIESSMLSVFEFAKVVVAHGTTAVVADPHEIANVLGAEGIRFILSSSKYCPIHVYMMLSSCVPASQFESSGGELSAIDLLPLFSDEWVLGLAEVMNYPGVVNRVEEVVDKLKVAYGRVIDGHAPGLSGKDLNAYVASGVQSDHECSTAEEAREKLRLGMYIMIREGGAARNLDALLPLVTPETVDRFIFVTDDKDVTDLLAEGQIDHMVRRAIAQGIPPIFAIKMAGFTAARYFGLRGVGAVAPGYKASLVVLEDLKDCRVSRVYHMGKLVAADGQYVESDAPSPHKPIVRSTVNIHWLKPEHLAIDVGSEADTVSAHIIEAREGSIVTGRGIEEMPVVGGRISADPARDIAKLAVIERHQASGNVGLGFVRGFGLQGGAIASSVAHDSHNLVVAGTNDADMFTAAVHIVRIRGGFCVVKDGKVLADVPLPIAGLMSNEPAEVLSRQLQAVNDAARKLQCKLRRPFMALSFLSLSVIGSLKLTDQGLVDVDRFERIDLIAS
ncbi:MAG: adenine deaminase [Phycisphaerae bacterium]|nr:adenine deaminase [Phycisphaerae bacterium]